MATSKDFIEYFLEQFNGNAEITVRPMMGEYLLYFRGKLVGDICDSCVFIKPIPCAKDLLPDAQMLPPYNGAKEMLVIDNFEDTQFMLTLFETMYPQLPEPKSRKRKQL